MKNSHVMLLALSLSLTGAAKSQQVCSVSPVRFIAEEYPDDKAAIEQVMADFHAAVVAHGGQRVVALSVPEGSTWFNVLSEGAFKKAQAKNTSVQKIRHSSFADFAKFVSSSSSVLNPQHTHLQIHSDGTIATVYFDYVFLIDGKAQNRRCETWQLVKAADGWKIAAITYSSTPAAS